jgi:CheY-like chemotaxis protein
MSRKILTVDDSATARFQVSSTLTKAGYQVVEAENGDDALKKLEEHPDVALVISDINMPWKDGIELLEELRANEKTKDLGVILLTTESNALQIKKAKSLGVLGYLIKPFNADALIAVVSKVCA